MPGPRIVLGFRAEGRCRKRRFIEGRYVDSVEYGLLQSEWEEERRGEREELPD